jgi:hypothetical protein
LKSGSNKLPRFYFSLPRLLVKMGGRKAERTEGNWLEANAVGLAVFLITYLCGVRLLPAGLEVWSLLPLLVALAFAPWLFWTLTMYINSLVVKVLRPCGLFRDLPANRAQSVLVGILTTVLALQLLVAGSWMRVIGAVWIAAVSLNLFAAIVLAAGHAKRPPVR